MIYWGSNSIFVTVQPSASLLRNPAHLKFAFAKGWILWLNLRILTDFAAGAKSWAELLPIFIAGCTVMGYQIEIFRL